MSKPSALAVACKLAPSIKSAMRLDLDDIDVDQRIIANSGGARSRLKLWLA
jgi:hypothetical protein